MPSFLAASYIFLIVRGNPVIEHYAGAFNRLGKLRHIAVGQNVLFVEQKLGIRSVHVSRGRVKSRIGISICAAFDRRCAL